MDGIIQTSFGPFPDISCAYYGGDFSKSLEQAQFDKHERIVDLLQVRTGDRVLDIGCGWGPSLNAMRRHGIDSVGLTLSRSQYEYCRSNGFNVKLIDWQDASRLNLGKFHGIIVMGALEHFCDPALALRGEQDSLYRRFFNICSEWLIQNGRIYIQTMHQAKNSPSLSSISLSAPKNSNDYLSAMVMEFYGGSWPSKNLDQLRECAGSTYREILRENGRNDYIRTMEEWKSIRKNREYYRRLLMLLPRWLYSRDFRRKVHSIRRSSNLELFHREILTLGRLVLETSNQGKI